MLSIPGKGRRTYRGLINIAYGISVKQIADILPKTFIGRQYMKLTVPELYNGAHVKIMRDISAICHQTGLAEEPRKA
jgi:hypothetical protein